MFTFLYTKNKNFIRRRRHRVLHGSHRRAKKVLFTIMQYFYTLLSLWISSRVVHASFHDLPTSKSIIDTRKSRVRVQIASFPIQPTRFRKEKSSKKNIYLSSKKEFHRRKKVHTRGSLKTQLIDRKNKTQLRLRFYFAGYLEKSRTKAHVVRFESKN